MPTHVPERQDASWLKQDITISGPSPRHSTTSSDDRFQESQRGAGDVSAVLLDGPSPLVKWHRVRSNRNTRSPSGAANLELPRVM